MDSIVLCDSCQKREAMIKFTQIIGEQKKIINLCKACALDKGLDNPLVDLSKVFGKLIIGIIDEHLSTKTNQEKGKKNNLICKECGLSWDKFQLTGRLGCPKCYESFIANMKFLLRRLHGCNRHVGCKTDKSLNYHKESIDQLEKRLKTAIDAEYYECAAELRDTIREKKQQQKNKNYDPSYD